MYRTRGLETIAMKWLWELFEGIQINAVLREKISLAEQKFKDMEVENNKLKERVTALTSEVAELTQQVRITAPTQPLPSAIPLISDEADALCVLQGWWGHRDVNLNTQAIAFDAVDCELNLAPGTAKRLLEKAVQKYNYFIDTKGSNFIVFRQVSSASNMPSWSNPGQDDSRSPFRRRR